MTVDPHVVGAVVRAARSRGLDPAAMLATGYAESGLRPQARNPGSGAAGLFQFLPSTWSGMGGTGSSMTDPAANATLAARGMAQAGARGLTGRAALERMISGFERPGPAGVRSDLSRALPFLPQAQQLVAHAGQGSAGQTSATPPSGGARAPGAGGTLPAGALGAFVKYLTQSQNQVAAGKTATDPFATGLATKLMASVGAAPRPGAHPVQFAKEFTRAAAAPTGPVGKALTFALAQQGVPYRWGGTSPAGFDCSGLVQASYKAAGIDLPRTTYEQIHAGTPVASTAQVQGGDLLFPEPGHVLLAISPTQAIEAPHTGDVVKVVNLHQYNGGRYAAIRRIVPSGLSIAA